MKKDHKLMIFTYILGIFLMPVWICTLFLIYKKVRERGINYTIIIVNLLIVVGLFLFAISPVLLSAILSYGHPVHMYSYVTIPMAVMGGAIILLCYNLYCCVKYGG